MESPELTDYLDEVVVESPLLAARGRAWPGYSTTIAWSDSAAWKASRLLVRLG